MKAPKIIRDTLQVRGKWSIKRLAGISGFYFAILYVFMPYANDGFIVHEFVFVGLLTFAASALAMTVWNKKIDNQNQHDE